jgi:hypothetical protein
VKGPHLWGGGWPFKGKVPIYGVIEKQEIFGKVPVYGVKGPRLWGGIGKSLEPLKNKDVPGGYANIREQVPIYFD